VNEEALAHWGLLNNKQTHTKKMNNLETNYKTMVAKQFMTNLTDFPELGQNTTEIYENLVIVKCDAGL
jgi:hypothetical protein